MAAKDTGGTKGRVGFVFVEVLCFVKGSCRGYGGLVDSSKVLCFFLLKETVSMKWIGAFFVFFRFSKRHEFFVFGPSKKTYRK